jgi:hypothetical protein
VGDIMGGIKGGTLSGGPSWYIFHENGRKNNQLGRSQSSELLVARLFPLENSLSLSMCVCVLLTIYYGETVGCPLWFVCLSVCTYIVSTWQEFMNILYSNLPPLPSHGNHKIKGLIRIELGGRTRTGRHSISGIHDQTHTHIYRL